MHKTTSSATIVKLESVCHSITDGKHGDCDNEEGSGYYFLSAKDVRDGKLQYDGARQITEGDFLETHKRTRLEPLDILISNSGTIGRIALAQDAPLTHRTTFQKSVAIVKPNKEYVYPHYLLYYLLSARDRLISAAGGTAQVNLLLRDLRAFEVAIYPLDLQKKIASILSAYDDLIENNTRRIKLLEQMAQAIYREWFVEFRAPGVKLRRATPEEQKVTGKDRFPAGWELTTLGEMCNIVMGQSPKSEFYNEDGEGFPFHQGVTDFGDRFPSDRMYCTVENRISEAGDVLFSVRAPVGRINIANKKIVIGRGLSAIRSKTNNQAFVFQQLTETFHEEDMMGGGTIFKSVTKEDMHGIKMIAPLAGTVAQFEETVAPMFKELEVLTKKNANLRQTRDLRLPRLVGGEIEISGL